MDKVFCEEAILHHDLKIDVQWSYQPAEMLQKVSRRGAGRRHHSRRARRGRRQSRQSLPGDLDGQPDLAPLRQAGSR